MADSPRGLPVKQTIKLSGLRKTMSQTMKASVQTAALSQVNREIDVTDLHERRGALGVSLNTLLMAVVARSLPNHPLLNAELVENQILVYDAVNLGMAVSVTDGLIVVVIPNADKLSLTELNAAIQDKAERARSGKLTMPDVEGGTFTVSNLGMYGIDGGFPIPRAPEAGILLIGAARPQPAVHEGQIAIRTIARFSINFDHRFIDGAAAAAFLQMLDERITRPDTWLEA
ncbi:MAG: 2-oxo acid dehydrogenase subunit E2 [Anaerolineae bacterium]|nr:2-oxo acid dehydrogenase subunit E2 [Anaerolineae bacterium]